MARLGPLVALLLLPAAARAQTPEDVRALTEALAADQAAAPPAAAPASASGPALNLSFLLNGAASWFSDEPDQLGGHDPQDTGFTFQQLEMHVDANVDHLFRMDGNIVFAQFGVEVEELYGTTLGLPAGLKARAGQFLLPIGRHNAFHPHSWSFLDQRLVNGRFFGSEGARGLGVELSWLTPLPWYVELVGATSGAAGQCCARSFYGAEDPRVEAFDDLLYTLALRQFFDLAAGWGLAWGLSAQLGPNPSGQDSRSEIYVADLYLRARPPDSTQRTAVSLALEVMHRRRQVPHDVLADTGGAAVLTWNINPRWTVGARYGWVQGLEADPLDPEWSAARRRASAQTTWHPSHFSRLRLQASHDDRTWLDDPVWAAMLGLELMIGAHGAHGY